MHIMFSKSFIIATIAILGLLLAVHPVDAANRGRPQVSKDGWHTTVVKEGDFLPHAEGLVKALPHLGGSWWGRNKTVTIRGLGRNEKGAYKYELLIEDPAEAKWRTPGNSTFHGTIDSKRRFSLSSGPADGVAPQLLYTGMLGSESPSQLSK
jgi:hypothetical protein